MAARLELAAEKTSLEMKMCSSRGGKRTSAAIIELVGGEGFFEAVQDCEEVEEALV